MDLSPLVKAMLEFDASVLPKSRVFVSYYHQNDQAWYNLFSERFSEGYDIFTDTSLEHAADSTSTEYLTRKIREDNITGSSVTIVLCGPETWKRRWVDWEVDLTLSKQHALLAVVLPTQPWNAENRYFWPERLFDNVKSDYAHWIYWTDDPATMRTAIAAAKQKACFTSRIQNSRPRMERSRP